MHVTILLNYLRYEYMKKKFKININFSVFKSNTALVIYSILITLGVAVGLILVENNKNKELYSYKEMIKNFKNSQNQQNQLPEEFMNKIVSVDIISKDNTPKFSYMVDTAETNEEKVQGLSGRDKLDPTNGMYFIYDTPVQDGYWMKDMKFPIDIIFINSNNQIVDIAKNLPTCVSDSECVPYTPTSQYNYVLEVNAGDVDKNGIQIGDIIQPQKFNIQ